MKMNLLTHIFNGVNLIIDTVGWLFAWLVKLILKGITSFCGWGISKIQSLPENIQIPISAMLVLIFIGIFLACLWVFPYIVIVTLIVIPAAIFLLKLFIGWIVLFSIIYAVYLIIKSISTRLWQYINLKRA